MTYESNLALSEQLSTPELYRFTCGATVSRYTTYPSDITFDSEVYTATAIRRSGFTESIELGSMRMTITAEMTDAFLEYVVTTPLESTTLDVYRVLQSDTTEYRLLYDGVMQDISFDKNIAHMEFEAQEHILRKKLGYVYQAWCNHEVFDSGCQLVPSQWRVVGTVTEIDGATISVDECAEKADGYFTGGHVRAGTDARLVTKHEGSLLYLQMAFDARVIVGTSVQVYPGCTGSPYVCENTFHNLQRFLGMAYIPSHNPAIWSFR